MEHPTRILVVQLQQLGDVMLSAPLLEDLRDAHPTAAIDFLTGAPASELVRGNPFLSELLVYDRDHPLRMPGRIRGRRYDWLIDLQSSPRTAPVTLFSGARRRAGWDIRGPWRIAYTDRLSRQPRDEYVVRQRQRMLELLGVPVRPRMPRIFLTTEERSRGVSDVESLPTPPGAPRVGLVLSARAAGSTWPVERYADLAGRIAGENAAAVVLGTVGDEERVARCLALAPAAVSAHLPRLRRFVGGLAALDLLVCGDTGPAHMAMAVGTPTVTLYGATDARHWNPGLPTTVAISSPRARCGACRRGAARMAPDHTCMLEIGVEEVHARVRASLAADAGQLRHPGGRS
ncbi:MAG TPA: glycosyltransferase family 9 protein [Gemmatimonadaceae bacterium]|nr:glycosyltransferase family 9 protein [Gemmatimonadaceae bacterium]